jgi:hypothetical protein
MYLLVRGRLSRYLAKFVVANLESGRLVIGEAGIGISRETRSGCDSLNCGARATNWPLQNPPKPNFPLPIVENGVLRRQKCVKVDVRRRLDAGKASATATSAQLHYRAPERTTAPALSLPRAGSNRGRDQRQVSCQLEACGVVGCLNGLRARLHTVASTSTTHDHGSRKRTGSPRLSSVESEMGAIGHEIDWRTLAVGTWKARTVRQHPLQAFWHGLQGLLRSQLRHTHAVSGMGSCPFPSRIQHHPRRESMVLL